jgi:hypothetical protein
MGGKLIHERSTKYDRRSMRQCPRRVDATNEHQPGTRRKRPLHRISACRISFARTISD